QHVRAIDELPQHVLAFRRLQVQADAALVAVDRQEVAADAVDERWPPEARVVAARRRFDLHDGRAHVAEHHRAEGPGENAREIEYEDVVEWGHGKNYYSKPKKIQQTIAPTTLIESPHAMSWLNSCRVSVPGGAAARQSAPSVERG